MAFSTEMTVRFAHVDGAGIVFYPRYLEMVNEVVERWFEQGLDVDFRELHFKQHRGAPTKRITVEFLKPSRLGDKLTFTLTVMKLGKSSFDIEIVCSCGGETRFKSASTLVYANLQPLGAVPIPEDMRRKMKTFIDG